MVSCVPSSCHHQYHHCSYLPLLSGESDGAQGGERKGRGRRMNGRGARIFFWQTWCISTHTNAHTHMHTQRRECYSEGGARVVSLPLDARNPNLPAREQAHGGGGGTTFPFGLQFLEKLSPWIPMIFICRISSDQRNMGHRQESSQST